MLPASTTQSLLGGCLDLYKSLPARCNGQLWPCSVCGPVHTVRLLVSRLPAFVDKRNVVPITHAVGVPVGDPSSSISKLHRSAVAVHRAAGPWDGVWLYSNHKQCRPALAACLYIYATMQKHSVDAVADIMGIVVMTTTMIVMRCNPLGHPLSSLFAQTPWGQAGAGA